MSGCILVLCCAVVPERRNGGILAWENTVVPSKACSGHTLMYFAFLAHEHLRRAHVQPAPLLALHKRQHELHRPVDVIEPEGGPRVPELERAVFPV